MSEQTQANEFACDRLFSLAEPYLKGIRTYPPLLPTPFQQSRFSSCQRDACLFTTPDSDDRVAFFRETGYGVVMRVVCFLLSRLMLIAIAAGLLIAQARASVESKLDSSCEQALLYDNVAEEHESAQDDFERSLEIDFHLPAIAIVAEAPAFYPRYKELCPTLLVLRTGMLRFLHTSPSPPSRA